MNIYVPEEGFPEEIRESAGAIFDKKQNDGKNHLAAEFLNQFLSIYQGIKREDYVEEYRRRSLVVGREIIIFSPKGERKAVATGVDEDCHLLVQYEDGSTDRLSSGEIHVRLF